MILELIIYEVSTTAASLLGLKALNFGSVKKQLQGISKPKSIPFVDRLLRDKVGKLSKTEDYISRKIVITVQKLSKYHAFRYLVVIAGRQIKESNVQAIRNFKCGRSFPGSRN